MTQLYVTDHALVRWLEQVEGMDLTMAREARQRCPGAWNGDRGLVRVLERMIDVEAVRARMLSPTVIAAWKAGATSVRVRNAKLVLTSTTVVTVLPKISLRPVPKGKYEVFA